MINTQLKLIFIDIPKTGSTAFKFFLIRGFRNFVWQPTVNPVWNDSFCPGNDRFTINNYGKVEKGGFVRHEPLISKYLLVSNIQKYFIFSIVRDPFERFKSSFIETMMHNRYRIKQTSLSSSNKHSNLNLHDPWYVHPHHAMSNFHETKTSEQNQADLIFDQLNILAAKGGFEQTGVCDTPIHFWPQYIFTSLTLPTPLKIVFVKYENLKDDFSVLREELSYITGVDVTKEELPFTDPTANTIFAHHNFKATDTMDYKFNLEKELPLSRPEEYDASFAIKYPTFNDFLPAYKDEKQKCSEYWTPILEQNRGLIEHLYAEDYRSYGYTPKL